MKQISYWLSATRPKTLPVSIAGVVMAAGLALVYSPSFRLLPWILCLVFAILAQIASNFANEYYDFKNGLDKPGREGPMRAVTEGIITPKAMKTATYLTLAVAALVGLSLIIFGGWLLLPAGILIALGALAYSTGPYPLSRHALGEAAVVIFFGIAPVSLSFYILEGYVTLPVFLTSVGIGLMGANILIVNNYRDAEEDRLVGKKTLANILGPRLTRLLYVVNSVAAMLLMFPIWNTLPTLAPIPLGYLFLSFIIARQLARKSGRELNPYLGRTALLMLAFTLAFTIFQL